MRRVCAAIIAALFFGIWSGAAAAQDVTLRSRDGAIEVTGTLLGFDGEFYRVETRYGELTVDGSGVLCDGPGCPSLTDFVPELRFSGAAAMGEVMVPALVQAFTRMNGYEIQRSRGPGRDFSITLTAGRSDKPPRTRDYRMSQLAEDLTAVVTAVIADRPFHLAAHDWGSIQSWESVTHGPLKPHILSYTSISGPCLDHVAFWLRKKYYLTTK